VGDGQNGEDEAGSSEQRKLYRCSTKRQKREPPSVRAVKEEYRNSLCPSRLYTKTVQQSR
jgi:hypothetical protein